MIANSNNGTTISINYFSWYSSRAAEDDRSARACVHAGGHFRVLFNDKHKSAKARAAHRVGDGARRKGKPHAHTLHGATGSQRLIDVPGPGAATT